MKSRVFLGSLGVLGTAVLVSQIPAMPGGGGGGFDGGGGGDGEDIYDVDPCLIGDLDQKARVGTYPNGTIGCGISTTGHNDGNVQLPWFQSTQVHHPVIAQNMYRVNADGRLDMIGMSWLKHAWFAVQGTNCGGCQSSGTGTILGIGCADTYGSSLNADQKWLGPRHEITPEDNIWMDGQNWTGSHFARNGGPNDSQGHNPVDHRLRIRDQDLMTPGANYYYEAMYVLCRKIGDPDWEDTREQVAQLFNNATHDPVVVQDQGNGSFNFVESNTHTDGPVIAQWGDIQNILLTPDTPVSPPEVDPTIFVSSRAVDIGGGQWRYEYCILNYTDSRGLRGISIPVGDANVTDIGVNMPFDGYWNNGSYVNEAFQDWGGESFEYDYSPTTGPAAWEPVVVDGELTFSTPQPAGPNVRPNDVRWGTMVTVWYTADAAPAVHNSTGVISRRGVANPYSAVVRVPETATRCDLIDVTTLWGTEESGNLASIKESDDEYYIGRSSFGFSAQRANMLQIRVRGKSPVLESNGLDIAIEGRLDNPGGLATVDLRDWDQGAWVEVHDYATTTGDSMEAFSVNENTARFIRDSDCRVNCRITYSTVATFSAQGFLGRIDFVDLNNQ